MMMKKKGSQFIGVSTKEPVIPGDIGIPGTEGFGVGIYPGTASELTARGLREYADTKKVGTEYYGNYAYDYYMSQMVFIPAFAFRIGHESAPSYALDGVNAIEIKSAIDFDGFKAGAAYSFDAVNFGDGWFLHRAFVDNGVIQAGFFIDKFKNSLGRDGLPYAIKGGQPLLLYAGGSDGYGTDQLTQYPQVSGVMSDAIWLMRARGSGVGFERYSLSTLFQWGALAMLSVAHGQAATSTDACAWFDPYYVNNFPKGPTYKVSTTEMSDYNDKTLSFPFGFAYNGNPIPVAGGGDLAKTTHNGQTCGVSDVCSWLTEAVLGATYSASGAYYVMPPTAKARSTTVGTAEGYGNNLISGLGTAATNRFWGNGAAVSPFTDNSSEALWSIQGALAYTASTSSAVFLFGQDAYRCTTEAVTVGVPAVTGSRGGIFARSGLAWGSAQWTAGFRGCLYPTT